VITVTFTGALKKCCPKGVKVKAATPRQVLEALKLHPKLNPKTNQNKYEAKIIGLKGLAALDGEWLKNKMTIKCLRVIPRLSGAGGILKNPVVRIVIGAILVYIALTTGQVQAADAAGNALFAADGSAIMTMTTAGSMALNAGIALAAGALLEVLAPAPHGGGSSQRSHLANTYGNTVKSGTPIPIILGEHLWGGHYISYNVQPSTNGYTGGANVVGPGHPWLLR